MRNCPNCGTAVREDAAFCRECGTRLQQADDVRRCPNCGTEVRAEAAFCRECGTRLQPAHESPTIGIAAPPEAGELVLSSWIEEPTACASQSRSEEGMS